jgi:ubiquinone/menaquinone biosynthesis C-methylase UbiE
MGTRTETLLAGEYFLAVQGLAMIRDCVTYPSRIRPRVEEIKAIVAGFDDFPNSLAIEMSEREVEDGYTRWAPRYDRPNPAIAAEEPIVHGLLAEVPVGDALDAACGTGRHAAKLVELGHRVVGVDSTEAMLEVARANAPAAEFRLGRLESLPVEDDSVDIVTCALALTHVEALAPIMHEFVRVLRPGGQVVLSDVHPYATLTGSIAGDPGDSNRGGISYVVNRTHLVSTYLAAFRSAGLLVRDCAEPTVTEETVASFPSFPVHPDATRQAFLGSPYLLIWHLAAEPG